MLSPLQVEILETAARSNGYVYVGVNPDGSPSGRYDALCSLHALGLVAVDMALHARITPAGRAALSGSHEDVKQASKAGNQKSHEKRHEYKLAILAGVFAIVAAVIGAILSRLIQ